MKVIFDEYTWKARIFPCIISVLPVFIIWFFLSENIQLRELTSFLLSIKFYGGITFSIVFLYFYAQVIRITSKYFENKYFIHNSGFPATYLMMYSDQTFSSNCKDKFRDLVRKKFGIEILDEKQETDKPDEARKRLNEATKQIILSVGDGELVKQQNIWYGFVRNMLGGAIYSLIICLLGIITGLIVNGSTLMIIILAILTFLYATLLVFRKQILTQNAEAYAKQLIAEFMSLL